MNNWWIVPTALLCGFVIIGFLLLFYALARSAKEADEMIHESFLKEVEELKKKEQ